MINYIFGNLDIPSTFAFAIFCICISIGFSVYLTTHKTKQDYEIEKAKLEAENTQRTFNLETQRAVEFKKLEQNLITSHREG